MKPESDGDTSYDWCARNFPKGLVRGLDELEIREEAKAI